MSMTMAARVLNIFSVSNNQKHAAHDGNPVADLIRNFVFNNKPQENQQQPG